MQQITDTALATRDASSATMYVVDGETARLAARAVALENGRVYEALVKRQRDNELHLTTLAHELRNPLSAITNALSLLDRCAAPSERITELRGVIRRQAAHLVRLVDDVLDMTRLRLGKLALRRSPVDLADVVRAALEACRATKRGGGHDVRVKHGTQSLIVNGDETRLEQVIRNLLDNAMKYSPAGTPVSLSLHGDGDDAVVSVQDEGMGIEVATLAVLFDPYAQAESARRQVGGGLGLGLPLVQAIVHEHGGSVSAFSEGLGKGSRFVVRLPLHRNAPP
jgi:signal transduction histidine kinase